MTVVPTAKRAKRTAVRNDKMARILDFAEKEFAARGYSATPLHKIAKSAKVNQALISYYFGSKEKLYSAIFLRRGLELSQERLRRLDELQKQKNPPTVEELIRSFLLPAIEMRDARSGSSNFLRLQARLQNEPKEITSKLRAMVYDDVTRRYIEAFAGALPHIDRKAIVWRVVMMIGAYLYIVSDESRLEQLSGGECHAQDEETIIHEMSSFFTGGLCHESHHEPPAKKRRQRSLQSVALSRAPSRLRA